MVMRWGNLQAPVDVKDISEASMTFIKGRGKHEKNEKKGKTRKRMMNNVAMTMVATKLLTTNIL